MQPACHLGTALLARDLRCAAGGIDRQFCCSSRLRPNVGLRRFPGGTVGRLRARDRAWGEEPRGRRNRREPRETGGGWGWHARGSCEDGIPGANRHGATNASASGGM